MAKVCTKCHETKDESDFSKNRQAKDGLQHYCKPCHRASVRSAPSQTNQARRVWLSHRTPEQKQRANDRVKRWAERHPFEAKLSAMERTARFKWKRDGLPVESFKYADVLARDGWHCYLCDGDVVECELSFDHVVPLYDGGPHSMENVRVAHIKCNDSKGAKNAANARWMGRGPSQRGCSRPACPLHPKEGDHA